MRATKNESAEQTEWQPITFSGDGERGRLCIEVLPRGGREEVGILDAIPFEKVTDLLSEIATGISSSLEKAKPKKALIALGVEFGLDSRQLVALIPRGTGKANLKIVLEWERS
jgi:hypothetical protein